MFSEGQRGPQSSIPRPIREESGDTQTYVFSQHGTMGRRVGRLPRRRGTPALQVDCLPSDPPTKSHVFRSQGKSSNLKTVSVRLTSFSGESLESQEAIGAHSGDRDNGSSNFVQLVVPHGHWCCQTPFYNPFSSLLASEQDGDVSDQATD